MEADKDLIQEYQKIITESENISITNVPGIIIYHIAVWLSSTNLSECDWEVFAGEIGLKEAFVLKDIKARAKCQQKLPEYVALYGYPFSRNGTLGQVICALLRLKRFDVLQNIKNHVKAFMKNYESRHLSSGDVDEAACNISENDVLDYDNESYVKSAFSFSKQFKKITDPRIQVPKQVVVVSVFLPHAEKDVMKAELIAERLRKLNISVKLPSEIEYLVAIDSYGALSSIMEQVDFLLPLISQIYVKQVRPDEKDNLDCSDADAMYNRFLHCCAQSEFINNGCLNTRVRPIAMGLQRGQLRGCGRELLFSFIFQLWDDMDRLVRILHDTKRYLLPQQPKHLGITCEEF